MEIKIQLSAALSQVESNAKASAGEQVLVRASDSSTL